MNEFDEWQKELFDFTMRKGRPFTAMEWQMMRHCFEMKRFVANRPQELRLAADGATVADVLEQEAQRTAVSNFVSGDGSLALSVTVRFVQGGDAEVYLKLSEVETQPAAGGHVRFGDQDDAVLKLDAHGRARIPCADYIALLERTATIRCAGADGVERAMEID